MSTLLMIRTFYIMLYIYYLVYINGIIQFELKMNFTEILLLLQIKALTKL